jgi:ABC-type dipeptide/oligopeptide/nickel transport system ATPase component
MQKLWIIHGSRGSGKSFLADLLMQANNKQKWNEMTGKEIYERITKLCLKHKRTFPDDLDIKMAINEPIICQESNLKEIKLILDAIIEGFHVMFAVRKIEIAVDFLIIETNENIDDIYVENYEKEGLDYRLIDMDKFGKKGNFLIQKPEKENGRK